MKFNTSSLSDLFLQLGLSNLSEEEKANYLEEWSAIVEGRIMARVISGLSEEEQTSLESLSDNEVTSFVQEHVLNLEGIVLDEVMKFREEMIGDSQYIKGQLDK